jgi:20S proteasome alpha/beta subunit
MTLVAGFRCSDGGILVCADREESGDGTKRSIDKLKEWKSKNAHFIFATSGTSAVVANLYARLTEQLDKNADTLQSTHATVISDVLRSIHKDFKEFKEWEELVIAASFYRDVSIPVSSFLYGTVGNALGNV